MRVVLSFALFFGLYLLFAGSPSADELVAGTVFAAACSFMAARLRRCGSRALSLHDAVSWPHLLGQTIYSLAADSGRVGAALVRVLAGGHADLGRMALEPLPGAQAGPEAAGRRALLTLGRSMSPNGIVVSVPDGKAMLWVHELS